MMYRIMVFWTWVVVTTAALLGATVFYCIIAQLVEVFDLRDSPIVLSLQRSLPNRLTSYR
jgi:hypothetical protein